jgi:HK97 family phage major capsid protein
MARERERTVLGRMLGQVRRVPFRTLVPLVETGSTAEWAGSGRPVKVAASAFDRVALDSTKIGVITVVADELARSTDPLVVDLLASDLITATALREDETLLSSAEAVPNVSPAGLLYGLTSASDVRELIQSVRAAEAGGRYFVASGATAVELSEQRDVNGQLLYPNVNVETGGNIKGIPLLLSEGANGNLILIAARTIAVADASAEIGVSRQSAVQMDDAPADGPANLVSWWQTNSVGLQAIRFVNWIKGYSDSVGYLSVGGSPS